MNAIELLKEELKSAHDLVEQTVGDATPEQLAKHPGEKAFPLGALYGHVVFSEDAIVNGLIQHKTPLYQGEWKEKTGANKQHPEMDENWEKNNIEWSNSVVVTLPTMREYAKAVYANTESYLNSLSENDLDSDIDLGSWGKYKLGTMLFSFVIGHACSLAGEMSAVKGVQGLKGYPF
jgi:hypothetical protein